MELNSKTDGLLLEFAVSIGINTGSDLHKLTLPLFVEKLDCSGAMVLRCKEQKVNEISAYRLSDSEQELVSAKAPGLFAELSGNEPFSIITRESNTYYVFVLPGYGLLALCFREKLHPGLVQKLLPLISHFANACKVSEKLQTLASEKEEYRQERSLLHAIIQNIPDPVYVKDCEGHKIIVNKAEVELLGATDISEVLGKKDSDLYSESVALRTETEDRRIIETGEPVIHRDGILTTRSGKEIWLQGTKIPHFDEKGKVSGIIGISHDISAYKKIEKEVRVVAEKYQSIFNSFVDLYYRSDLNGTIIDLSPSVYRLFGYQQDELIGQSVTLVYADIEKRNMMIDLLVEKGFLNDFENLMIHKNGNIIPVSITCRLVKDLNGKPGYIEGTIRNISERKEADEKLNKLLSLQNLLTHLATEFINIPVENSNEAIGRLLSVIGTGNEIDRTCIFEYDFVKNTLSNTYEWCAENISPEIENLQQIPTELLPSWVDSHKNGDMVVVQDVNKLDINDSQYKFLGPRGIKTIITIPLILRGDCLGFVSFNMVKLHKKWSTDEITFLQILADLICNITDRKRKDEALRNREASLKAIFNNVPFQMWLKDVNSKYQTINKPFMDYFSITSESDILGKDALDIWNHDTAQHFIEQDKLVMQTREPKSVEEFIDFKHKKVWFEIFRAPIIDQNGQLLGTTGIARDITDRKTADKILQLAVEEAQAATEAKSKFLAIMSHEIRNPLNAVVGMVRMLHDAGIKGPNSKLIENIKISSDHLLMIINDILDFSKIEAGDMILEETSFDIHEIVKRVADSNIYIAQEKQIDLKFHVDKHIGHSHTGDPLRLLQVLSNLISNAIKFTSKGSIQIRCELENKSGQSDRLRFEVQDTGIGINVENQEKIFESFKQENNTISRTHGGSGLGLAISKQIVELMGGSLHVESEKNVGSKFHFSVNMLIAERQSLQIQAQSGVVNEKSLHGYAVLLVEDNRLNQILATTMLENWGAKVVVAGNGQEAVDIITRDSFDIILMDIQMPVMDGMTASRLIRDKLQITTPIFALSANVIKGIVEKCEEAGMQGYISKPFDPDDLYKKIISHVSVHKINSNSQDDSQKDTKENLIISDISRLEKMIGSDPDQLIKMLDKFLEITPLYLAELNKGDSESDLVAIAAASHKIKSSIDLVSAPLMRDLILNINNTSRNGCDIIELKVLIKQFNKYYSILETQLRQEINAERVI